jgi:hypothetical protein
MSRLSAIAGLALPVGLSFAAIAVLNGSHSAPAGQSPTGYGTR